MKLRYKNISSCLILMFLFFNSCSSLRTPAAPTTPFLNHGSELKPIPERLEWDAVWSSDPGHIVAKHPEIRKIYVDTINIDFLNKKKDANGVWSGDADVSKEDIEDITNQLHKEFTEGIQNHPETSLQLVDQPGPDTLILAIALVELIPTKVSVNALVDVGGVLLPGSKLIEDAGNAGAQIAAGSFSGGSIAIELKLLDGKTAKSLVEAKDRESDPASIIPNYRDFEALGWSRSTCKEWAKQFIEGFSTTADVKIEGISHFSLLPW